MKTKKASDSEPLYCGVGRKEAVLLSVFLTLEALMKMGRITGPKRLTSSGRKTAKKLKASGFEPTEEEVKWAVDAIITGR